MRRFSISDVIISVVAIIVVCAAIVPAVARLQRTPEDARCQSNMRRWAAAIDKYTADWDGCYPVNRLMWSTMVSDVSLSPRAFYPDGSPMVYVNSINWVEAMYPYIIADAANTGSDWESFMKCPNTADLKFPPGSTTSRMTYAFNFNLLAQPVAFNRNRNRLMMMREMDRMVGAVCRPINNTTNNSTTAPQSPFLTTNDFALRGVTLNSNLHTQGSHILFVDGHVKYFDAEYYPSQLTQAGQWDSETRQWWNWVNKSGEINKAIAITP